LTWQNGILDHYWRNWKISPQHCAFSDGPLAELPRDFCVVKFAPHADRNMWTYATCAMSQPNDASKIELHIFSPVESVEIEELLFAVAHFHRTGAWLDLGHSVNFGRPWIAPSICDHGLVSLPYLDGPTLEDGQRDQVGIKFYWLIPITASEKDFKKNHGLEALEECFDRVELDYVNPMRGSVV
jgi:Suppressor of fused protein (SUFU)